MKRIIILAFVTALVAGAALGGLGDVVSSFRAPSTELRGLARSNTYLYAICYTTPNVIYRFNPDTGLIRGVWETPRPEYNRGLAFSWGGHLWIGCYQNDTVYDCNHLTGSLNNSWSAGHDPYGLAPQCTGDGGRGTTALFSSENLPGYTWRHRLSNGSILSSFQPGAGRWDIAYDHRNKLIWTPSYGGIFGYRVNASRPVASFAPPATEATGMAYHGEYLFIGCTNGYVYRVHCPGTVPVSPASLGKIKALYR